MATTKFATAESDAARTVAEEVGSELARVDREIRALVSERPVLALVGAIATGFVLGRILRRR